MPSFAEYVVNSPEALATLRQAYLADVTEGGTWGAEIEARHLAQIFGVHIVFWTESPTHKFRIANQYNHGRTTLHILCRGSHFEALRAAPAEGDAFSRMTVVRNSGGGDCLYRAFHQAYSRNDNEPNAKALRAYRSLVAQRMRQEREVDLEGLLVTLLDEVEMLGFALGAGPTLQRAMLKLYRTYRRQPVEGGGSIPPFGRVKNPRVGLGERDPVPRKEMTIADRMLDRIGRLVATVKSVHVALALDGNALVVSANDDTDGVLAALKNLLDSYSKKAPLVDPFGGLGLDRRVPSNQPMVFHKKGGDITKTRRNVDLEKIEALRDGRLEALTSGKTKDKLQRIKAALAAGLLVDNLLQTPKQQYLAGDTGIYLIPHVPHVRGEGVVHGEMNVTAAIQERRRGKKLTDDVFVGGTLIDCFDCNQAHKARNKSLSNEGEKWRFYSGGTHGNSFPNWYLPPGSQGQIDRDTFSQARFPTGLEIEWWDTTRGTEYGYNETRRIWSYYFTDKWRNVVLTNQRYYYPPNSRRRIENQSGWFDEPYTKWESTPRTYLTDLFLRQKDSIRIVQAHSSFADDSDSDADDYDELIVQREKVQKEQKLKLRRSYQEELPDLAFVMDPEYSLPFSFDRLQHDPMMSGALVMYTSPVPRMPRLEFYISPEILSRLQMPDLLRPQQSRQGPPVRGFSIPKPRPMPQIAWGGGTGQGGSERPRARARPTPDWNALSELRRLLWTVSIFPAEFGDVSRAVSVPGRGELVSFNLGLIFDLFWLLSTELGIQSVALTSSLEDVLDELLVALFRARMRRTMQDPQFVELALVALFLRHVLVVTRFGGRTIDGIMRVLLGPFPRVRGL